MMQAHVHVADTLLEQVGNSACPVLEQLRPISRGAARFARDAIAGRSVIDPVVVEALLARRGKLAQSPLARLTPRESDVLREMAQSKTNAAVESLSVSESAVEKYGNAILSKVSLTEEPQVHRRAAAVLAFLRDSECHTYG